MKDLEMMRNDSRISVYSSKIANQLVNKFGIVCLLAIEPNRKFDDKRTYVFHNVSEEFFNEFKWLVEGIKDSRSVRAETKLSPNPESFVDMSLYKGLISEMVKEVMAENMKNPLPVEEIEPVVAKIVKKRVKKEPVIEEIIEIIEEKVEIVPVIDGIDDADILGEDDGMPKKKTKKK